jgi:L-ascorbate metabolism protein UlaG (beta-lactamase superfamily)
MADIKWFGHNCFRIRAKEATVLCDPLDRVTGYAMQKQTADIVTISHDHPGHSNLAVVKPEFQVITGPGEYELHDVFVTGVRTYHDDQRGKERGYNTCYLIEVEGIVFCHLGDLGHVLSAELAEAMANADVLMVPAGGGTVLSPDKAAEVVGLIEPKIVIPMQYHTEIGDHDLGAVDAFCKALGVAVPEPVDKLSLRQSDIGETMRVMTLTPDSDGVKK